MGMSNRAAVYLRISLDQTGEAKAVARQREDALALIEQHGWDLHEVYQDNSISASRREKRRPDYERMRADFEANKFGVIVCYDLDRLTRQPAQLEQWIEAAETRGLRIVTLNGEADLGTDGGRLYARIKAAVARGEVERMGARRKRSNEQNIAEGRPAPGRRPYGWEKDGITLREDEAAIVRSVYAALLAGESLRALVRDLNARGIPSPQETPWTAFKLKQLVDRERNHGALIRYGVEQQTSLVMPIVDRDTHEKAQAIIAGRSQPGRKPEKHLLSGIVFCAVCSRSLGAKALKSGKDKPREPYYVCTSRINRNVASDGATHPTIRAHLLEQRVRDEVTAAFLFGPADLFPGQDDGSLGELHQRLKSTREEMQRLVSAIRKGIIKEGRAAVEMASLDRDEDALVLAIQAAQAKTGTGRLADIRQGVMTPGKRVKISDAAKVKVELGKEYDALSFDSKRSLIEALLDVRVALGFGAKRANVTHKVVTSLNENVPSFA